MKKNPRKPTITTRAADESLGRRLTEALSDDELRLVLVRALLALDEAGRQRLLDGLDVETRAALTQALNPPKKGSLRGAATPVPAGRRKLQQEWEALWARWDAIVAESRDEKGRYVQQDRDWDAPYLALGAVADDLEVVGAQFRAMMPAVIAADLAPDLRFSEILDDLGEELGAGLPEWIEAPDGDDFVLGPETSSLVLEWDWTMEQAKGVGLAAFLDEWRDVEERLTYVSLHEQSIRDFVMAQPEPALRDFLKSVTRQRASPRWSYAFNEAYGVWAKLVRELTSRWDPALFAATSRANIVHDWTLALPLVKDAIAHERFDEAATLIDEAVRVRLKLEPKEHWDPRTTLFAHAGRTYPGEEHDASTGTLLGLWKDVAEARSEGDLVAALTVQLAAQVGAERGDAMLKALGAVPPRYKAVREALFGEWRRWFVARTLSQWRDTPAVACGARHARRGDHDEAPIARSASLFVHHRPQYGSALRAGRVDARPRRRVPHPGEVCAPAPQAPEGVPRRRSDAPRSESSTLDRAPRRRLAAPRARRVLARERRALRPRPWRVHFQLRGVGGLAGCPP